VDDGIYSAVFDSEDNNVGTGIVVARKGKLHGGDSACMYRGEHNAEDDTIKVEIVRHKKEQKTIFGDLNYYTFTLKRDDKAEDRSPRSPLLSFKVWICRGSHDSRHPIKRTVRAS
jgi:hypothetical protein